MKYLFGPVNSRRLGISLGIDLVPFKTCTLNCVYCECGATTDLTASLKEYAPALEVMNELKDYLSSGPRLDAITFSGSGEPTLHSGIGTIIDYIKENFPGYNVVVLTNGTLLWKESVRRALINADIVIPSLDAVSEEVFRKMLRPVDGIGAEIVIEGLISFAREFSGKIVIEIFIVPGINDGEDELRRIKNVCLDIKPHKIQLNRLDRPGTETWVKAARRDDLIRIAEFFRPLKVELVGEPSGDIRIDRHGDDAARSILSTIQRRPCTIDDMTAITGVRKDEIIKIIDVLEKKGIIASEKLERGIFYKISNMHNTV